MKHLQIPRSILILSFLVLFVACGGGGSSNSPAATAPPAPVVTLGYGIKQLQFSWDAVGGATYYKLLEDHDGASGYSQVGTNITATNVNHDISLVHRINAKYRIEACNSGGCTGSSALSLAANLIPAIGYFKASNTGLGDQFGYVIALSDDGNTLAVGAPYEASNATVINGDQANNLAGNSGAVYVFIRSNNAWSQQAYVKASNTEAGDLFGCALALSSDGSTLAIGAMYESTNDSGAVYVFTRSGSTWSQQAYVKSIYITELDWFGSAIALSADGNTLAVGAYGDSSRSTGINDYGWYHYQTPNWETAFIASGAVYVFIRSGTTWSEQAYVKASNTGFGDEFGYALALSADGNTLAIGAHKEDSNATGIDGSQADSVINSGAVYVFTRNGATWSQQAYVKASNTGEFDEFGYALALSADGNTLAVGGRGESSNATGINGDQSDDSAGSAGAVYIFTRSTTAWSQQTYVKASNTNSADWFGSALSLSADGNTLAIGAYGEDSIANGINGEQADDSDPAAGAVYIFKRGGSTWLQQAYVKASNTESNDAFGKALALAADGSTLVVGAYAEGSTATGINSNQADNSAGYSGAVYLY